MTKFRLSPYYHPTTVCFVDDNESYLESLVLQLPPHWSTRCFTNPAEALAYLNAPDPLPPLVDRCLSLEDDATEAPVVRLDLNLIGQEINHRQRFARRSVAVIDYAMPIIDGLDLCAQLTDPYLKKALLTGVADEVLAVEAFNDGLIHRYEPKQKISEISAIVAFVLELQQDFFYQYTSRLSTILALRPPDFLSDAAVAGFVRQLMAERGLVEYYLVGDPPGFLFLTSAGEMLRLIILGSADMETQVRTAAAAGAPRAVLSALRSGDAVANFAESPADYFGDEPFPWDDALLPAIHLPRLGARTGADSRWRLGIDNNPPSDIDFYARSSSYDAHLRNIRQNRRC